MTSITISPTLPSPTIVSLSVVGFKLMHQNEEKQTDPFLAYKIVVKTTHCSWTVMRRFQQFVSLQARLQKKGFINLPPLPRKHASGSLKLGELRERELQIYLSKLVQIPGVVSTEDFQCFIAASENFFIISNQLDDRLHTSLNEKFQKSVAFEQLKSQLQFIEKQIPEENAGSVVVLPEGPRVPPENIYLHDAELNLSATSAAILKRFTDDLKCSQENEGWAFCNEIEGVKIYSRKSSTRKHTAAVKGICLLEMDLNIGARKILAIDDERRKIDTEFVGGSVLRTAEDGVSLVRASWDQPQLRGKGDRYVLRKHHSCVSGTQTIATHTLSDILLNSGAAAANILLMTEGFELRPVAPGFCQCTYIAWAFPTEEIVSDAQLAILHLAPLILRKLSADASAAVVVESDSGDEDEYWQMRSAASSVFHTPWESPLYSPEADD